MESILLNNKFLNFEFYILIFAFFSTQYPSPFVKEKYGRGFKD
jgi:hypothetical protein